MYISFLDIKSISRVLYILNIMHFVPIKSCWMIKNENEKKKIVIDFHNCWSRLKNSWQFNGNVYRHNNSSIWSIWHKLKQTKQCLWCGITKSQNMDSLLNCINALEFVICIVNLSFGSFLLKTCVLISLVLMTLEIW